MGGNTLLSALADSKTSMAFWTIFLGVYSLVITYVVFRFFYLLWGAGKGPIKHYGEDRLVIHANCYKGLIWFYRYMPDSSLRSSESIIMFICHPRMTSNMRFPSSPSFIYLTIAN